MVGWGNAELILKLEPGFEMDLERRKFVRWLTKYHPGMKHIIVPAIISVSKFLESKGFMWVETSIDGCSVQIPSIEFNKKIDEKNYYFIDIDFNKCKLLQFSVIIGKMNLRKWREDESEYYLAVKSADFVKMQNDSYYRAKLWGARWYHIDKVATFKRHWAKLEQTIPALIEHLENGKPHPNIR